ncbi:MAG: 6-phospho-3-hexuloisomerase [Thermoplasmatota archaeon]
MRLREAGHYIVNQVRAALDDVADSDVEQFLSLVGRARSVVVFGRGRSGLVGRAFVMRLLHLGIPSYFVGETVSPPVHGEDLVVLISGSGETFSVIVTGQIAKKLGCPIVAITADRNSQLAHLANHTIVLHIPDSPRQRELAPLGTLFESSCQVFFDALVAELMQRRHESEETMRKRHATLE